MDKTVYTVDEMDRLGSVHRAICAMRRVEPQGLEGRLIAEQLIEMFSGTEAHIEMIRTFLKLFPS